MVKARPSTAHWARSQEERLLGRGTRPLNLYVKSPTFSRNHSGMSLAEKNFQIAIKDSVDLADCFDSLNRDTPHSAPEVLKRASLIMMLTAWETYVEDRVTEILYTKYSVIYGSQLGNFIEKKLSDELKRFNNPNSIKTKNIFLDFVGVDVTDSWRWANVEPDAARTMLNQWLRKRGDAVHRSRTDQQEPHIVKREELDKCVRFFIELVAATELALHEV